MLKIVKSEDVYIEPVNSISISTLEIQFQKITTEKNKTIFIVDNDELNATMLSGFLTANPLYKTEIFHNGEDCVKQLAEQNHPDAIIFDYILNSESSDAVN